VQKATPKGEGGKVGVSERGVKRTNKRQHKKKNDLPGKINHEGERLVMPKKRPLPLGRGNGREKYLLNRKIKGPENYPKSG